MQLPDNLQHFAEPTLILIGDFGKTIIYKAEDININELRTIEADEPARPDSESSVAISKGRRTQTDSGIDDGEDRKKYAKELALELTDLIDDHGIKDIQLIMPTELHNRLLDNLSKDITELITRHLDKNLTKTDLVEALERLHETPAPIK